MSRQAFRATFCSYRHERSNVEMTPKNKNKNYFLCFLIVTDERKYIKSNSEQSRQKHPDADPDRSPGTVSLQVSSKVIVRLNVTIYYLCLNLYSQCKYIHLLYIELT